MSQQISECIACSSTGLYQGFCEPSGTAVICLACEGKGWLRRPGKEFTGRKKKPNVTKISLSRGANFISGMGAVGKPMSYSEFESNYPINLPK